MIIEKLTSRKEKTRYIEEENENLGTKKHLSRAAKAKFVAAALAQDPEWLSKSKSLTKDIFQKLTLDLSLQDNGNYI